MGRKFGQHFLHDRYVIKNIIDSFEPSQSSAIAEIGPGKGALTHELVKIYSKLTVFEIDPYWVKHWQSESACQVVAGDVLDQSFFECLPSDATQWSLIGNLPYQISGPFMIKCIEERDSIACGWFLLQKEVVERCAAGVGEASYNGLSIWLQRYYHVKACFQVSPGSFNPPPRVDSQMMMIMPKKDILPCSSDHRLHQILRLVFSYRRKTMRRIIKLLSLQIVDDSPPFSWQQRPGDLTEEDFIWLVENSLPISAGGRI